jgi:hypothetical protein
MIVIRIELWGAGDSRNLKTLDQLTITNVGFAGYGDICTYEVRHGDRMTTVRHRRSDGALELARLALAALRDRTEEAT